MPQESLNFTPSYVLSEFSSLLELLLLLLTTEANLRQIPQSAHTAWCTIRRYGSQCGQNAARLLGAQDSSRPSGRWSHGLFSDGA